ncbi:metallophosphoesterase family protein [Labilibaculum euxinus]|uniref:Calcineurin-like phosphoesterase domain-containing protein n=1 Tax=Labilibaculum euxinus TaxID=2686357 RepID=A0A7M4D1A0_9BACT|nr:metallophosphoesterase [Labilibaculum euxinus]MUP36429.1 hypothetical protein [Labilibaculum euxinus]MVB05634.1 hypothetical protein [Labilibaculum euxinus]
MKGNNENWNFTDLHISSAKDIILSRIDSIVSSCFSELSGATKLFIVVSGDIANKGLASEYDIAKSFLTSIRDSFLGSTRFLTFVEFIIVPGNHDCNFSKKDPVRDVLLQNIRKQDDVSVEIVEQCLKVQEDFWAFHRGLTLKEDNKISNQRSFPISNNKEIIFNTYNTSWSSSIGEKVGSLIIPEHALLQTETNSGFIVSLFHHPTNWLSTNTDRNNKKFFEGHLLEHSNLVLCGHEHEGEMLRANSLKNQDGFAYFEGVALQNIESGQSGFGLIIIDSISDKGQYFGYEWKEDVYIESDPTLFDINAKKTGIILDDKFRNKLNDLSVPIKHSHKEALTLSDVFIYPDLDPIHKSKDESSKYVNSSTLFRYSEKNTVILEGDSQSGKTSLLYKLTHRSL